MHKKRQKRDCTEKKSSSLDFCSVLSLCKLIQCSDTRYDHEIFDLIVRDTKNGARYELI